MSYWNQASPDWGSQPLGASKFTMKDSGCYTCMAAYSLSKYGKPVTPGTLNDALNLHGGYDSDGMIQWDAISKLYPDCFLYGAEWTTDFPDPNTARTDVMKTIADVKRAVSMGFVVGLCVACPSSLGRPNHIVACDYAPTDIGQWMIADSAFGDYVKFEDRYGSVLTGLYGIRILMGPPTEYPTYSLPKDKSDGNAAWKASMVARGMDVTGIYVKEILDSIMSGG